MKTIPVDEWNAEGVRLFGQRGRDWKFICPACGTVQSGNDLLEAGMEKEQVLKYLAFSCIGRFMPGKGCDWTLGGLLHIHELEVIDEKGVHHFRFEFATPEAIARHAATRKKPIGRLIEA